MYYYVFPMATNSRLSTVTRRLLRVALRLDAAGLFIAPIAANLEGMSGFTFEAYG